MHIGLDLGTSGVKALMMTDDQRLVGTATGALEVSRPHDGWSEQAPAAWIHATEEALYALKASHPIELAAVKGIGLSGQMHGATLLDGSDQVLRPCILWNDTRSWEEAAELDADPAFRSITGNIVFPGFTAPKLVWVSRKEPAIFDQTAKVLLPKDYLRLWLTGEHIGEMSDCAGTSWLDTAGRSWSSELLEKTGLSTKQMPALVEGTASSGKLRTELAQAFGMTTDVVVAGGAGDNAASAVGMGTITAGAAFVSLGTSGVLFAATDAYRPNADSAVHTFCHCLPDTWHQMGVILSATDTLNWFAGITGRAADQLTDELGEQLEAPSGLTFLPYLSGERTPHNDASIRGAFLGLAHGTDRALLTRAVLEGVAFAFADNLKALAAAGTSLQRVTAIGGGSRSTYWLKLIATILGIPVDVPVDGDFGAAFGAARLGLIAATGADPKTICTPPIIARTIEPEAALKSAYDDAYARFSALYPLLKDMKP
ncbi:MAG: xylulokinase [Geminicoccaceae bacterium]